MTNTGTEAVSQELRREEIKTYRVRSYHVGCGGEWLSQGQSYTDTFKTRFLHRCDKCTALMEAERPFPALEYT